MRKLISVILALINVNQCMAVIVQNKTGKDLIVRANFEGSMSEVTLYARGKEPFQHLPAVPMEIRYKNSSRSPRRQVAQVEPDDRITITGDGVSTLIVNQEKFVIPA